VNFYSIGICRHRMGIDGKGITTLVGGLGCPLECRYCLNPQCRRRSAAKEFTVEELYEAVKQDSLYFSATGGGVTFGGGEPLLQAEFIREFIVYCKEIGEDWRFSLETCLAVYESSLALLDGLVDEYIVDVKDMNGDIYRAYTGNDLGDMKRNLLHLVPFSDRVPVKTPLIPDYNSEADVRSSQLELSKMGFSRIMPLKYITEISKS